MFEVFFCLASLVLKIFKEEAYCFAFIQISICSIKVTTFSPCGPTESISVFSSPGVTKVLPKQLGEGSPAAGKRKAAELVSVRCRCLFFSTQRQLLPSDEIKQFRNIIVELDFCIKNSDFSNVSSQHKEHNQAFVPAGRY